MADQPGFTRIPNDILEAMPQLGNAELRVLLAIARKTVGYQKECDRISVSQITDLTGLTSRNAQRAITSLLAQGLITRESAGKQAYCYTLQTISPRDTDLNHVPSDPMVIRDMDPYPVGTRLEAKPYPLGTTQKKDLKEKRKEVARTKRDAPLTENGVSPHKAIMDAYATALDYPMPDGPASAAAAKKLVSMGYTPEQVAACYKDQKARDFWRDKHLSLQSLTKCIGAWAQNKKPAHRNGSGPLVASKPNMPEHAVPLADLAAAARKQREQHHDPSS